MVLEETTSAQDSILRTQLRRAYGIDSMPESEAAYYDCQPSALNLISVCSVPLASSRSTRRACPMTTQPTGRYVTRLTRTTKIKHEHGKLEVRLITPHRIA